MLTHAPEIILSPLAVQVDLTRILAPALANWPWYLAFLLLFIVIKILGSARFKGWFGERAVSKGLSRLDPNTYHTFHDIYLPRPDGQGTTQLDHVVVSPFGIFVIETKNYRGWIFGSEKQAQWTQQIYRQKNRFQNPIHQNDLHVRALIEQLELPRDAFVPVVFFIGESEFKTPMPANVLNKGLRAWILQHQETRLDLAAIEKAAAILREIDLATDRKAAAKAHVAAIQRRSASK